jgi:hypothetical protein
MINFVAHLCLAAKERAPYSETQLMQYVCAMHSGLHEKSVSVTLQTSITADWQYACGVDI